jgi:hypothetical protein
MDKAATDAARSQVFHSALPRSSTSISHTHTLTHGGTSISPTLADRSSTISISTAGLESALEEPIIELNDWLFELSPSHQIQLQSDLTSDWPLGLGLGGGFDFWRELQGLGLDMEQSHED